MKLNIDLTENLDFNKPAKENVQSSFRNLKTVKDDTLMFTHSYDKSIGKFFSKYILDIPYCINEDIEHNQKGGLTQGNGDRRKFIEYEDNPYYFCERCGRKKKYPWEDFNRLLCPKCENDLEREMNKIPWKR